MHPERPYKVRRENGPGHEDGIVPSCSGMAIRALKQKKAVRAGIITFHAVNNFGAVLQAYALCRTLRECGCEACVIDYQPDCIVGPYHRLGYRPMTNLRRIIRNWRFNEFRRASIKTSACRYKTEQQLLGCPPDLDACVCGSDQIWNLKILEGQVDRGYFLGFGSYKQRRVAYAPSFGDGVISGEHRDKVAQLLGKFDALSARENAGRSLIKKLTGRDVPLVLDPSLLIDDYSQVINQQDDAPERYILAYPLEQSEEFTRFLMRVQQLLRLPVVNVGTNPLRGVHLNRTCLGPSEWLGWVRRASFVCTNSFHGTAFSIAFQRDFACSPHQQRPTLNDRILDLLEKIGLSERFVSDATTLNSRSPSLRPVDYSTSGPLLRAAISQSLDYLRTAVCAGRSLAAETMAS